MTKQYEIETTRKVYDNENGGYFEVGPDMEGLGLVRVGCEDAYIVIPPEHALHVAKAIELAAREMME